MHHKSLAAGFRPDPLGELKRSPDPLAVGVAASRSGHGDPQAKLAPPLEVSGSASDGSASATG